MKVYRCEVQVAATLYIKADSPEEAVKIAKTTHMDTVNLETGEVEVSGKTFDSSLLPDVSFSPVATVSVPPDVTAELAADNEDDDDDQDGGGS